jgi:hypothetical protein
VLRRKTRARRVAHSSCLLPPPTMDDDYKRAKEAFVSDTTGSSMGHINTITFAAIVSLPAFSDDVC